MRHPVSIALKSERVIGVQFHRVSVSQATEDGLWECTDLAGETIGVIGDTGSENQLIADRVERIEAHIDAHVVYDTRVGIASEMIWTGYDPSLNPDDYPSFEELEASIDNTNNVLPKRLQEEHNF